MIIKTRQEYLDEFTTVLEAQFGANAVDLDVSNDLAVQLQALATVAESLNFSLDMLLDETSFLTSRDITLLRLKASMLQIGTGGATPQVGGITATYSGTSLNMPSFTIPANTPFDVSGVPYISIKDIVVPAVRNRSLNVIKIPVRQIDSVSTTKSFLYSTVSNNELPLDRRVVADTVSVSIQGSATPLMRRKSLLNVGSSERAFVVNTKEDGTVVVKLNNGTYSLSNVFVVNYKRTDGTSATQPTGQSISDVNQVLPQSNLTLSIDDVFSRAKDVPELEDIRNLILSELNNAYRAANTRDLAQIHLAEANVSNVDIDNVDGYTFNIFVNDGSNTTVSDAYLAAVKSSVEDNYQVSIYNLNYFPLGFCVPKLYININSFSDINRLRPTILANLEKVIKGQKELYLSDIYQAIETVPEVSNSYIASHEILPYIRKVNGAPTSNLVLGSITTNSTTLSNSVNIIVNIGSGLMANIYEDGAFAATIDMSAGAFVTYESQLHNFLVSFDMGASTLATNDVFNFVVYPATLTRSTIKLNEFSVFHFDPNQITIN